MARGRVEVGLRQNVDPLVFGGALFAGSRRAFARTLRFTGQATRRRDERSQRCASETLRPPPSPRNVCACRAPHTHNTSACALGVHLPLGSIDKRAVVVVRFIEIIHGRTCRSPPALGMLRWRTICRAMRARRAMLSASMATSSPWTRRGNFRENISATSERNGAKNGKQASTPNLEAPRPFPCPVARRAR